MLAVPYFEKRLYELPDAEVTAERVLSLADEVERDVELGPSPRPLLSVPHPLSDESSAYYHGYVLAEMAVHQTRAALATRVSLGSSATRRRMRRVQTWWAVAGWAATKSSTLRPSASGGWNGSNSVASTRF